MTMGVEGEEIIWVNYKTVKRRCGDEVVCVSIEIGTQSVNLYGKKHGITKTHCSTNVNFLC